MTDAQALKTAIAIMTCDKYTDCGGCYLEYVDCQTGKKVPDEAVERIKQMLIDMGYPYGERSCCRYEGESNEEELDRC